MTDYVFVVAHMQMSNALDLTEDTLQLAVAGPGVGGQLKVGGGGGLQLLEGLEPDVLQLVSLETQQSQTPQRSQSFCLDHREVVVAEQKHLQVPLPAQQAVFEHIQPVSFQIEEAQSRQAAESPDIHRPDAVVTEVQFPQILEIAK